MAPGAARWRGGSLPGAGAGTPICRRTVSPRLLPEERVDIVVGDLGEGACMRWTLRIPFALLYHDLEDPFEIAIGALDAQPYQAERGPVVEDDDEDRPLGHDGDMDVVLLPLVEQP